MNITYYEQFEKLENMLKEIKLELLEMNSRLLCIEATLNNVDTSTQNMDNHISFVEDVFTVVRKPFINVLKWYNRDINFDKLIKDKQS